MLLNNPKKII